MIHHRNLSIGENGHRASCVDFTNNLMVIGTKGGLLLCYQFELMALDHQPQLKNIVYPSAHDKTLCTQVTSIKFSHCSRFLATGFISGAVVVYNVFDLGQTIKLKLKYYEHDGNAISSLAWAPDSSKLFSGCAGGRVVELDLTLPRRENKIDEAFQLAVSFFGGAVAAAAGGPPVSRSDSPRAVVTECGAAVKHIGATIVNSNKSATSGDCSSTESLYDCLLVTPERQAIRHFLIPRQQAIHTQSRGKSALMGRSRSGKQAFATLLDKLLPIPVGTVFPAVLSPALSHPQDQSTSMPPPSCCACFVMDPAVVLGARQQMKAVRPARRVQQRQRQQQYHQYQERERSSPEVVFGLHDLNASWSGLMAYGADSIQRSGFGGGMNGADESPIGENDEEIYEEESFAAQHLPESRHDSTFIVMGMARVARGREDMGSVCSRVASFCPRDQSVTRNELFEVHNSSSSSERIFTSIFPVYTAFGTLLTLLAVTDDGQLALLSPAQDSFQLIEAFTRSRVLSVSVSGASVVVLHRPSSGASGVPFERVSSELMRAPAGPPPPPLQVDLLKFIHPEHVLLPAPSFCGLTLTRAVAQLQQGWRSGRERRREQRNSFLPALPSNTRILCDDNEISVDERAGVGKGNILTQQQTSTVPDNFVTSGSSQPIDTTRHMDSTGSNDWGESSIDQYGLKIDEVGINSEDSVDEDEEFRDMQNPAPTTDLLNCSDALHISSPQEICKSPSDQSLACALGGGFSSTTPRKDCDDSVIESHQENISAVVNCASSQCSAAEKQVIWVGSDDDSASDSSFHPWLHSSGGSWHDRWVESLQQLGEEDRGVERAEDIGVDADMRAVQRRIFSARGRRVSLVQGNRSILTDEEKKNGSAANMASASAREFSRKSITIHEAMIENDDEEDNATPGSQHIATELQMPEPSQHSLLSFPSQPPFSTLDGVANMYSVDLLLCYSSLGLNLGIERESNLLRVVSFNVMPTLPNSAEREPNVAQLCGLIHIGDVLVGIGDVDVSHVSADEGLDILKRIVSNARLNNPLPRPRAASGVGVKSRSPVPPPKAGRTGGSTTKSHSDASDNHNHSIKLSFVYNDVILAAGGGGGASQQHRADTVSETGERFDTICQGHDLSGEGGRMYGPYESDDDGDDGGDYDDSHNPLFDIFGFGDSGDAARLRGGRRRSGSGGGSVLTSDALMSIGAELKKRTHSSSREQVFPAAMSGRDMLGLVSSSLFLRDPEEVQCIVSHLHKCHDELFQKRQRVQVLCSAEGIERQIRKRHVYPRMGVVNCIVSQIDTPSLLLPISDDIWSAYLKRRYYHYHQRHRPDISNSRGWLKDSNIEAYRSLLERLNCEDFQGLVLLLEREVQMVQQRQQQSLQKILESEYVLHCSGNASSALQNFQSCPQLKCGHLRNVHLTTRELHAARLCNLMFSPAFDTTAIPDHDHDKAGVDSLQQKKILNPAASASGPFTPNHTSHARQRARHPMRGRHPQVESQAGERGLTVNTALPAVDVSAVLKQLVSVLSREQAGYGADPSGKKPTSVVLQGRLHKPDSPRWSDNGIAPRSTVPPSAALAFPARGSLRCTDPSLAPYLPEVDLTCHVFDTLAAVFCNALSLSDIVLPRVDLILLLWMNTFIPMLPANVENKTKYLLHHAPPRPPPCSSMDPERGVDRHPFNASNTARQVTPDVKALRKAKVKAKEATEKAEEDETECCMQEHKLRVGSLLNLHLLLHTVLSQLALRGAPSTGSTSSTPAETCDRSCEAIPLLPEFRLMLGLRPIKAKMKTSHGRLGQWSMSEVMAFFESYGVYLSLDLVVTVCGQYGAAAGWNSFTSVHAAEGAIEEGSAEKDFAIHEVMRRTASLFIGMHIHHHPHAPLHHFPLHLKRRATLPNTPDMFGYGFKEICDVAGKSPPRKKLAVLAPPVTETTSTDMSHPPSEHPEEVTMTLYCLQHLLGEDKQSPEDCTHILGLCAVKHPYLQPWVVLAVLQGASHYKQGTRSGIVDHGNGDGNGGRNGGGNGVGDSNDNDNGDNDGEVDHAVTGVNIGSVTDATASPRRSGGDSDSVVICAGASAKSGNMNIVMSCAVENGAFRDGCDVGGGLLGLSLCGLQALHEYYCHLFTGHHDSKRSQFIAPTHAEACLDPTLVHNWLELCLCLEAAASSTGDAAEGATKDASRYQLGVEHILFADVDDDDCSAMAGSASGKKFCYSPDVAQKLCAKYGVDYDNLANQSACSSYLQSDGGHRGVDDDDDDDGGDDVVGSTEEILRLFANCHK